MLPHSDVSALVKYAHHHFSWEQAVSGHVIREGGAEVNKSIVIYNVKQCEK